MQRNALAHALDDDLQLVWPAHLDIRQRACRHVQIQVYAGGVDDEAEGEHLDGAATALGIQRDPEFAPARGG